MTLEQLNNYLARDYGYFEGTLPNWRVVWSEDQFEKRLTDRTDEGFELLHKEVRLLPKYKQWAPDSYVLERCLPIPEFVETDLTDKFSYEPVYVFDLTKTDSFSDNFYGAIKFVISTVYTAVSRSVGAKYKDPEADKEVAAELREQRLRAIEQELFGNETEVGDALAHKQAVIVPGEVKCH